MQGFGILTGGAVAILVSYVLRLAFPAPAYSLDPLASTPPAADYAWRIILMAGAIPAALTYHVRKKLPETPRYTALVAGDQKKACQDMSKVLDIVEIESDKIDDTTTAAESSAAVASYGMFSSRFFRRHGLHLVGTAGAWFFVDVAYYSQNLFQKDIFSAVGWLPPAATMSALDELFNIARAQSLIALCGTVPGYWFTVALIDRIGRFMIQALGFLFMTVFMFSLAIPYAYWTAAGHHVGFIIMYGLTFFFANFGPNATTFVVPAEIFPARFRSTCHGISAAAGKAGAIVGAFGFLYAAQSKDPAKTDAGYPAGIGMRNALIVLGFINLAGLLFTFLVPEAKGKSLEEISGDNEEEDCQQNPVSKV